MATSRQQAASVMAATRGRSVIAWCEMKKNCGMVAVAKVARTPARGPKVRRTVAKIPASAAKLINRAGKRSAHSGCAGLASGMKSTPKKPMLKASIQKSRTGFDQNHLSCAHQRLIQSFRARISRATSP